MDSRKRVYLFLPFLIAFALFASTLSGASGILYADVDVPDVKRPVPIRPDVKKPVSKPYGEVSGSSLSDVLKRIEALESRTGGGNVTTGARSLKIGFMVRTRFEQQKQFMIGTTGSVRTITNRVYNLNTASLTQASGDSHTGVRESNEHIVQRTRIYFDADVNKNVRAYVRIADNRVFGATQHTTNGATGTNPNNEIELNEGYVDLRNLGDISPLLENISIRAGRWQMFYGGHRLIGHLNWTNAGRKWDGARVKWDNKKGSWIDFFATKVTTDSGAGSSGDAPSRTENKDELFWGVYSHFKNPFGLEGTVAEPYLIIRDRSVLDRSDSVETSTGEERYTAGLRLVGKKIPSLPGVDFVFDHAWQFGHTEALSAANVVSSNPIQAFAGSWGVGYTFSNAAWKPRIGYQYAFASGDDRPGAGSAKTFSQLYPTGHARMGYIDFHAWMNIRAHKVMLTVKPTKKLLLKADLWFFEADEEADDWYNVAGGTMRQGGDTFTNNVGVTGNIDDEYGQEIDITAKYKLFKNFGVVAGYTHYFTGDFMEDTNNGLSRDSDWAYLMTSLKF